MIYYTGKIPKMKWNRHKELTFHPLKSCSVDVYEETLARVSFPNCRNFDNPDIAYSDFITEVECVIKTIALFMTVRIKNNASEWFDEEITDEIHRQKITQKNYDKLHKKF